jgi:hypothetical protein
MSVSPWVEPAPALLVEAVRDGGGGGLVDDAEDAQARDGARVQGLTRVHFSAQLELQLQDTFTSYFGLYGG